MILFLLLGQESLDPESLVRRHGEDRPQPHIGWRRRAGLLFVTIVFPSPL